MEKGNYTQSKRKDQVHTQKLNCEHCGGHHPQASGPGL